LIPSLAITSSHWKDFPCPLPPQMPRIRGTCQESQSYELGIINPLGSLVLIFILSKACGSMQAQVLLQSEVI